MSLSSFIAFSLLCTVAFTQDLEYTNSLRLSPDYVIYWAVDQGYVYIGLEVNTLGWVGFGIAEPTSGSMAGSDIVTAYVEKDGTVVIDDMYATSKTAPLEDRCQDWEIVRGEQTSLGQTIVHLRRKLNTGDLQDRPIESGPSRIIWAFGELDSISYHMGNRGMAGITFYTTKHPVDNFDPDAIGYQFLMPSFKVPIKATTYACTTFTVPQDVDYHIVQFDPLINSPLVHFLILYLCKTNNSWVNSHLGNAQECWTDPNKTSIPLDICSDVIWTWSQGMSSYKLPYAAGFRVPANSNQYLLLEIRYDNSQNHLSNVIDNSGATITFTPHLRPNDAGVITAGDPLITMNQLIPANEIETQFEFSCSTVCTSRWPYNITIFGDFLHLHRLGTRAASLITPLGSDSTTILTEIDFYATDAQRISLRNISLGRGDRLNTHCVYSSTYKDDPTKFGVTIGDEQCLEFIYYYPAIPNMNYCGYYYQNSAGRNFTVCGNPFYDYTESVMFEFNPSVEDGSLSPYTFGSDGLCQDERLAIDAESVSIVAVYQASPAGMAGMIILSIIIIFGMNIGLFICALKSKEEAIPVLPSSHSTEHVQLEDH